MSYPISSKMYSLLSKYLYLFFIPLLTLSGCYYSHPNQVDHWQGNGSGRLDSVNFYIGHHYWVGYNFVTNDSLSLQPFSPQRNEEYMFDKMDDFLLGKNKRLVVADVVCVPADSVDSVWVKVAHDQLTQGWIHESELLEKVTPDDPISKFIEYFSSRRSLLFWTFIGVAILFALLQIIRQRNIRVVHFNDIPNFYPTLLCLCISGSAVVYGSMQKFVTGTWVEFYYHPTLNPFNTNIPFILSLFLASVWTTLFVAIAVVDELRHRLSLSEFMSYMTSLGGVCIVLYLIFTLTTPIYIGYPLLVVYWLFAVYRYWCNRPTHLFCGMCGKAIESKGRCPHCGAINT